MIVNGATYVQLENALKETNLCFDGNIIWNHEPELMSARAYRWRLTLRCKSSKAAGHRISHAAEAYGGKARNTVSACWHVHGTFFDALPTLSTIFALGRVIRPGDAWQDFNVGSIMYPMMASESCGCEA